MDKIGFLDNIFSAIKGGNVALVLKLVILVVVFIGGFVVIRKYKKWKIDRVRKQQARDEIKDDNRLNEKNEKANKDLNKNTEEVNKWAEEERNKNGKK